jgi:transcriptional regulator with XRE-family HTH domain
MGERFGTVLREWRGRRRVSQLELSTRSGTTQRHVSFVESGRARPSREMVLRLSEALDVPLRVRNELLVAAGYAPLYPERPLDAAALAVAQGVLARILTHHEPYPAMVLDGAWNILMRNATSSRIVSSCVDEAAMRRLSPDGQLNFMRMMFAPHGMRGHVRSWEHTGPILVTRLRREAAAYPGSPSSTLLSELVAAGAPEIRAAEHGEIRDELPEPVVPLELSVGKTTLRLLNTITTFGTPQDVTLQELRVEMSFPADDATDRALRRSLGAPRRAGSNRAGTDPAGVR